MNEIKEVTACYTQSWALSLARDLHTLGLLWSRWLCPWVSEGATLHVKLALGFLPLDWMDGTVLWEWKGPQGSFLSNVWGQTVRFFLRPWLILVC